MIFELAICEFGTGQRLY